MTKKVSRLGKNEVRVVKIPREAIEEILWENLMENESAIMVSEVGRTISGSSSGLAGTSLPSSILRRECVTIAISLAKPSTCSASFWK